MSIVRDNLMTRKGYTPYCGNTDCRFQMPRTRYIGGQFQCGCGWRSSFDDEFIEAYEAKWGEPSPQTTEGGQSCFQITLASSPSGSLGREPEPSAASYDETNGASKSPSGQTAVMAPTDYLERLSDFLDALDEWGCEDNAERAEQIIEFQRTGYDLDTYLVEHSDREKSELN